MERNWTTKGTEHNGTPDQKEKLGRMFDNLEWHDKPVTMGMMQAEGIKVAIESLKIPKVSHVATSNEMAPYGLLAVRGHFSNGWANVYFCDEGSKLVVLASDFHPTPVAAVVSELAVLASDFPNPVAV